MPVTLVVNKQPYNYPVPGDSPGWGAEATGWAEQVTEVLQELFGDNDIAETTFNVANNVTSFTNVVGLILNTGAVRAATITYSVYRVSTANPSGHSESGTLRAVYDNSAGSGSKWALSGFGIDGDAGITFQILDSGQVQYKTTDINSTGYSGVMHFSAKTLGQ